MEEGLSTSRENLCGEEWRSGSLHESWENMLVVKNFEPQLSRNPNQFDSFQRR